jgi:hypothetical protein
MEALKSSMAANKSLIHQTQAAVRGSAEDSKTVKHHFEQFMRASFNTALCLFISMTLYA